MRTFKVNGTEYKAKPFDFNLVCDLEDMGIRLEEIDEKRMSMIRAYFAICTGKGKDFAGKELNAHCVNGGKFDDIIEALNKEMEDSDFFQSLLERAETKTAEDQKTENKKEEEK